MTAIIRIAVLSLLLAAASCSRPPDLDRVLGHTPAEVRDYFGDPASSDPESETYNLKVKGQTVPLSVIYRGGKAVLAATIGPGGLSKNWTEQQFREWLGNNCTIEIESGIAGIAPPEGAAPRFSATVRPPCTPRVY